MEDLISIVLPVYNVEAYLVECVESLIKQTYKNIEIILVDDGSTDRSPKLCDEFAKKDERVKVFHKENGGAADSRNYGMERAHGRYFCFVDSDDFVEEDYVETLYKNLVENEADIAVCGFSDYFDDGRTVCKLKKVEAMLYDKRAAHIHLNVFGYIDTAPWNKIYKRELFEDISFPVGKICEDWRIMYKLIDKAERIYYDSAVKYYYRKRENSVTSARVVKLDEIEAALEAAEFYEEKNYQDVLPYAYQSVMMACMARINSMIYCEDFSKLNYVIEVKNKYKGKMSYDKLKFGKKAQLFVFVNFTGAYIKLFKKLK